MGIDFSEHDPTLFRTIHLYSVRSNFITVLHYFRSILSCFRSILSILELFCHPTLGAFCLYYLLNGHTLGQVTWFVHIGALE